MTFVFDLDDTICDTDSYSEQFISNFFKTHGLSYKKIADNVRFAEMKFDWPHEIAHKWYLEFGDEILSNLPVKGNSVEVINNLHDNGHKIVISTARATDWHKEPFKRTFEWLNKVGLKYDILYVGRNDKENICEKEDADVFVDDDINIVSRVNEYFRSKNKGQVFLSATGYNQTLPPLKNIKVVKNFYELIENLQLNHLINSQEKT